MIENRGLRVEGAKSSRGSNVESRAAFVPLCGTTARQRAEEVDRPGRDGALRRQRPKRAQRFPAALPPGIPQWGTARCPYRDWDDTLNGKSKTPDVVSYGTFNRMARQRLGVRRRAKCDAALAATVEPSGVCSHGRALPRIESGVAATAVQNLAECSDRVSAPRHSIFETALESKPTSGGYGSAASNSIRSFLKRDGKDGAGLRRLLLFFRIA